MLPWRECLKQQSPGDAWAGRGASQENLASNSRFSSTFSNRLSRQRHHFGALFFGCRSRPARASFSIFAPVRVRLSTRASLPGGYDFARDAWFAQLGAVGNVLGRIEVVASPVSMGLGASAMMAIDRGRNGHRQEGSLVR